MLTLLAASALSFIVAEGLPADPRIEPSLRVPGCTIVAGTPVCDLDDQVTTQDLELLRRINELDGKFEAYRELQSARMNCIRRAVIGAGLDLGATGWGLSRCESCREANPLGVNADARVGLKFLQVGASMLTCYAAPNSKIANISGWISFTAQAGFAVNNSIHAIRGH